MQIRKIAWRGIAAAAGLLPLVLAGCQSELLTGSAAPTGPSPDTLEYVAQFKRVDSAGKGSITIDQATAYYTKLFAELDTNHDGFLDAKELQPLIPLMRAKSGSELLSMLDRNGDNKLSQKEFVVLVNWLFQRAKRADEMTLADAQTGAARAIEKPEKQETPEQKKASQPH
jgi:hypothetical protein